MQGKNLNYDIDTQAKTEARKLYYDYILMRELHLQYSEIQKLDVETYNDLISIMNFQIMEENRRSKKQK